METKGPFSRENLIRDIFINLAGRWDVKDRTGAYNLARASVEIAEGFLEGVRENLAPRHKIQAPPRRVKFDEVLR